MYNIFYLSVGSTYYMYEVRVDSSLGRVQIKMPSMPRMPSICPVDIFVPRSLGIFILNTRHFYAYKYDQYYEHIHM